MDCKTARLLLDFVRPSSAELDPSETEALQGHLAGCAECDALARAEHGLDRHIGRAVRSVPVPDDLRGRLLDRLQAERGRRRRRTLAWTVRLSAAAAVLVLAAWGVLYLLNGGKPAEIEWADLRDDSFLRMTPTRERVEEYFRDNGLPIVAPDRFNYALLAHYDVTTVQGKKVPLLVFVQGPHRARVYIVSNKQFDLEALSRVEPSDSGGQSVVVWRDEQHPHLAYLIIYSGDSLQRFLTSEPQSDHRFGRLSVIRPRAA